MLTFDAYSREGERYKEKVKGINFSVQPRISAACVPTSGTPDTMISQFMTRP